jgi:hypothetical protein
MRQARAVPHRSAWHSCTIRAEFEKARDLARRFLQLAQSQQDPWLLCEAHFEMGVTLMECGELASALRHLEQGIACWDVQKLGPHRFWHVRDPGIACRSFAAWVKLKFLPIRQKGPTSTIAGGLALRMVCCWHICCTHIWPGSRQALEYAEAGMAMHEHGWHLRLRTVLRMGARRRL